MQWFHLKIAQALFEVYSREARIFLTDGLMAGNEMTNENAWAEFVYLVGKAGKKEKYLAGYKSTRKNRDH